MLKVQDLMRCSSLRTAALAYAKAGWRVFPVYGIEKGNCLCDNPDCQSPGKHPMVTNWPKVATSDFDQIRKWFHTNSKCNIGGIPPQDVSILDIDGPKGKESFESLDIDKSTALVKTRRGKHRYYRGELPKGKTGLLEGLDLITGDGLKYVILPPSNHKTGRYQWGNKSKIRKFTKEELQKICNLLVSLKENVENEYVIPAGQRNNTIFKFCAAMVRRKLPKPVIVELCEVLNNRCCNPALPNSEVVAIVESGEKYAPETEQNYGDLSAVKAEEVSWYWYPYLARGSLVILEGPPGQGKSYLTMFLAALTSTGGKLPFSDESLPSGRVLILNAEDDPARILRPRIEKCGGDLSTNKIRFQLKFVPMDAEGLEMLEAEISAYRPDLVIVDPMQTFMVGDMHRYNEVTLFLAGIEMLAREYNCCIIGVRHLTKANNDDAMSRGLGSVGFSARARSVIQIGKAPDNEEESAMAHVKTNWGQYGATLVFKLKGGGRDEVPELQWVRVADYGPEALNRPREQGRPNEQVELQNFLRPRLEEGPANIGVLMRMATAAGLSHSKRAFQRALEQIAEPNGAGPKTEWSLK